MIDCSVVIPIYNPETGIEDVMYSQYDQFISSLPGLEFELIIVDDGSAAGIAPVLEKLRSRFQIVDYIQMPSNQGKGAALRKGVAKAKGDIILYTDYDFPYRVESMIKMYKDLSEGLADLAIGIRPESYYEKIPKTRKRISKILQRMNRSLMKLHTGDTQAGLKAFKKNQKELFLETDINGFLFDLQFLKKAKKNKIEAKLIEIELREKVQLSEIRLTSLIKEVFSYFSLLFK